MFKWQKQNKYRVRIKNVTFSQGTQGSLPQLPLPSRSVWFVSSNSLL
uniref:Uncharacterized protein n=1 Tax=Arundo donax TaxID=35708 RepID=A0A0A9C589_ARUDO